MTKVENPRTHRCQFMKGPFETGQTVYIPCKRFTPGRTVKISLQGPSQELVLCEVEIYGFPGVLL